MNLALHIEQLPEAANKLSVKLGKKRTQLAHVHSFAYLPTEEEIMDCLVDYGYGYEYGFARLVWNDDRGRQVKTYSLSTTIKNEDDEGSTVKALVNGLLEMAAEQRRFLGTLNATLQQRENTLTSVLETLMLSREESLEHQSTALALDIALQDKENSDEMNYKDMALETLANLGQVYIAKNTGNLTPEMLKAAMASNPDIVDNLLDDDDFVSAVTEKIMSSSS